MFRILQPGFKETHLSVNHLTQIKWDADPPARRRAGFADTRR